VKEYQYFQPELIELIASENIYDEDRQQPWEVNEYSIRRKTSEYC